MSAAKAIADHLRDWIVGSNDADDWQSMAVYSTGSGYPGVPENLYFSLPVSCRPGGHWSTVPSLRLSPLCEAGLKATADELIAERDEALAFLQQEGTPSLKTRSL